MWLQTTFLRFDTLLNDFKPKKMHMQPQNLTPNEDKQTLNAMPTTITQNSKYQAAKKINWRGYDIITNKCKGNKNNAKLTIRNKSK